MAASAKEPQSQCSCSPRMKIKRRAVSIPVRRAPKQWRRQFEGKLSKHWRPTTRGDCKQVERPCPYVGCRYNLYLDVTENGTIKINFPWITPLDIPPDVSCALDIAERGGVTLDEIADAINLTRERVRQVEQTAIDKVFIDNCCEGGDLEGYDW